MSPDHLANQIADSVAERLSAALTAEVSALVAAIASAKEAKPLVDVNTVAQFFGVSVMTIRRMVGEGMPVEWVATEMRFDIDECRSWNKGRGKRSVTKEKEDRKRASDGPVGGVTLKSRTR